MHDNSAMTTGPDPVEVAHLDRVLGRGERLFGLAAAFVLFLITSALSAIGILAFVLSLYSDADLPYAPIMLLLALPACAAWWSGHLLYREWRGKPRTPSPMAQVALGLLAFAAGVPLAWSGVQSDGPSDPRAHDLYLAGALILSGATWTLRAWRRLRDEDVLDTVGHHTNEA